MSPKLIGVVAGACVWRFKVGDCCSGVASCAGSAGLVVVDLRTTDGSIPFASSSLREASMIAAIYVAMELMLPCMELMLPCMELMLPSMEVTLVSNCIVRGIAVEVEGVESP